MQSQELRSSEPYLALSKRVAQLVKDAVVSNPEIRLGLPTGSTPTGTYDVLSDWSRDCAIDWSKTYCFGLDEYLEGPEQDSFRRYLYDHLYKHTNVSERHRFSPYFQDDYDALIESVGGLDLTLLGIGTNGHIAFNEPGTPLESHTHCVTLTDATIQANKKYFSDPNHMPQHAVTMGLRTILASKQIVLLASGERKKAILDRALNGPVTSEVPASFLQLHKNVQVCTDFS